MISFTTYDLFTGQIVSNITCAPVDVSRNTPICFGRIDGTWDGQKYYVLNGEPTLRQQMNPVVNGLVVSNLPIPCTARIEGEVYEIDDGTLELDPNLPGPYTIYLDAVPYLPCTVTIQ